MTIRINYLAKGGLKDLSSRSLQYITTLAAPSAAGEVYTRRKLYFESSFSNRHIFHFQILAIWQVQDQTNLILK